MKKQILNTIIFSFGLFVISCNSINEKTDNQLSNTNTKVTIYDYQIRLSDLNKKELRDSLLVYIDTLTFNNRRNYIYYDSAKYDSSFRYSYSIERDSFFFFDEFCKTLDTIPIKYNNKTIELIKSDYDIENSADEESYIYWSKKYGLVAVYNYPWGALILFDNEEIIGFAKEVFYNFIINQEKKIQKEMMKKCININKIIKSQ